MDIDGSFQVAVDRTAWGDISLTLSRHDVRIYLDPGEAARICQDLQEALGHYPVVGRSGTLRRPATSEHARAPSTNG